MADTCFIVPNTERGWAEEGREIMQSSEPSVTVVTCLENRTTQKSADGSGEDSVVERELSDVVLNLQYFFPYCDQYLKQGANRQITLIILCQNNDDRGRVCCYLQGQETCHPGLRLYVPIESELKEFTEEQLKVYTGEENRLARRTIGALCPLLRIGEPLENKKQQPVCTAIPYGRLASAGNYYTRVIDAVANGQPAPELEGGEQNIQLRLLLEAGKEELLKIPQELSGTRQDKMLLETKDQLCSQLWEYIRPTLRRLPLLTQVIWLYSLRYLNKQKEIMTLEEGGAVFHKGPVDLALWDAIAYGEGILQLLENCTQHSRHKAGYFTLNFHYVALHQNHRIVDAAGRREQITRRYRASANESFLGDDEKFYLEFNITDMAMEGNGRQKGSRCSRKSRWTSCSGARRSPSRTKMPSSITMGCRCSTKRSVSTRAAFCVLHRWETARSRATARRRNPPSRKSFPGDRPGPLTEFCCLLPIGKIADCLPPSRRKRSRCLTRRF